MNSIIDNFSFKTKYAKIKVNTESNIQKQQPLKLESLLKHNYIKP